MKETELFEPVCKILENKCGCTEIYAEVLDTDVLGINGPANIVVEMKTSLNMKVIEQAYRDTLYAHYVYIAVPRLKYYPMFIIKSILRPKKIGLIFIDEAKKGTIIEPARFNRVGNGKTGLLRLSIKDYSSKNIGGAKSGETITDYSRTITIIKTFLKNRDWVSIDRILEDCETHYAKPKPSVSATLKKEWNQQWCEYKYENKKLYFRYRKENIIEEENNL